jgi:hypothetical protein
MGRLYWELEASIAYSNYKAIKTQKALKEVPLIV